MDEKVVEEILNDLYSAFEDADTQSTALMLFMKDQGIATDEKLAPYLDQAGKASDVKWRAARARMTSLLKSAMKATEPETSKKTESPRSQAQGQSNDVAQHDGGDGRQGKQLRSGDNRERSRADGDVGDQSKQAVRKSLSEDDPDKRGGSNQGQRGGGHKDQPPSQQSGSDSPDTARSN